MKLERPDINELESGALLEVIDQRDKAMAETAELRNQLARQREAFRARESELEQESAQLQNRNDNLTIQMSDMKRQLQEAQRQLRQQRENHSSSVGALSSESPLTPLLNDNMGLKHESPETKRVKLQIDDTKVRIASGVCGDVFSER
ncbi:hypothetical protein BV22DRAFT_1031630 [Leucogyrophana mollusca]|uniref:Uncharacterized protein n=1 Tax=Leucogyrophana mollusca TaxID=85980 RepID=A0ACB8BPZ0_9AGAM|nr:hypothetical protein BV22DRAFT_1031630 [Leucogyrophana mollusca]